MVDAPVLANRTGHTVHVRGVQLGASHGVRIHEVRAVPVSSEIVYGQAYDPAHPAWADTSVIGPDGITLQPGAVVHLAYVLDVDRTGGSFPYSVVTYTVGPLGYRATYPGANAVLPAGEADCSGGVMEQLAAHSIP
ncbi:hypothetical protein MWU57_05500 [Isoptericola sp. S6320L]|uniref:hypothetical protein n=1 Tax=Isoptericola sp. S6320L TaxID=2926411 RepID=UPI001FF66A6F|nr:hypothetical protein [Isoptericola sp. S6320L]MCK0116480.1 hypothetical protein [Isoptericola sp. S6320L]